MSSRIARIAAPGLALVLTAGAAFVPAQEAGKRLGEKLDQAGRGIRGGLNRAGEQVKGGFAAARTSVEDMGIEARVYGRLHWDKALNDASIDLSVSEAGVVTLNGSVASARAKAQAAELAGATVGVTEVVDRLAVRPAATVTPARAQSGTARP